MRSTLTSHHQSLSRGQNSRVPSKADTVLFFLHVLHVSLELASRRNKHGKRLDTTAHELVSHLDIFPSHNRIN